MRLAMLVVVSIMPAAMGAIWLIAEDFRAGRDRVVADSHGRARTVVGAVDRELESVQAALAALATSPLLAQGDVARFYTQAKETQQAVRLENVVLSTPDGRQLLNTRVGPDVILPLHGNRKLVTRIIESKQPAVSDLFVGNVTRMLILNVGVPVVVDGKATYVLTAAVSPRSLGALLAQQNFPPTWIVAVLDTTGTIVARTHQADKFVGQTATPLLAAIRKHPTGTVESTTLDGVPVVSSFIRSSETGWTVVIGIPRKELLRPLWESLWLGAALVSVLLSTGLFAAWRIGRKISDSIHQLVAPAVALGYGEVVKIPTLYFKEAQRLGESISGAAEMLSAASLQVAEGEARMSGILQSAMDAIITVDVNQNVVLFNEAAEGMFGWRQEEAVGRSLGQFIPERFRSDHTKHIATFGSDGTTRRRTGRHGQILGLKRGGEEFQVEASISQLVQSNQKFYTVILRDITEQVESRAALERSNIDLKQFAYVASHDLKGPLRSINGFVKLLERDYSSLIDDRGVGLLQRTAKAASRLEQLTDDLLVFAQIDAEAPAFAPVKCGQVIDEVVQLLQGPIANAQAVVKFGGLPVVLGAHNQLVHLFLNLVGNAIKYRSDRPPSIHITCRRSGKMWAISVSDNGIGIDPKHFDRLFEVFHRLHSSAEYEGTGIGLALCRRIADRHGGSVSVASTLGAGSTFTIHLPAA